MHISGKKTSWQQQKNQAQLYKKNKKNEDVQQQRKHPDTAATKLK